MADLNGFDTKEPILLGNEQHRLLVALRYINAAESLYKGLEYSANVNPFHFLISLRSFIEYSRRGIWFLLWASDEQVTKAEHLTFRDAGSPKPVKMDAMINEALGFGQNSFLTHNVAGINEPFINLLHALTHGNPISVRVEPAKLVTAFDIGALLLRAEQDLNIFRVLLYRKMLGEDTGDIWSMLRPIHADRAMLRTNVALAAMALKRSGKLPNEFLPKG